MTRMPLHSYICCARCVLVHGAVVRRARGSESGEQAVNGRQGGRELESGKWKVEKCPPNARSGGRGREWRFATSGSGIGTFTPSCLSVSFCLQVCFCLCFHPSKSFNVCKKKESQWEKKKKTFPPPCRLHSCTHTSYVHAWGSMWVCSGFLFVYDCILG